MKAIIDPHFEENHREYLTPPLTEEPLTVKCIITGREIVPESPEAIHWGNGEYVDRRLVDDLKKLADDAADDADRITSKVQDAYEGKFLPEDYKAVQEKIAFLRVALVQIEEEGARLAGVEPKTRKAV